MWKHVGYAWAVATVIAVIWAHGAASAQDPQPESGDPLQAALDALHGDAAKARDAKDFATVEALRKQRLSLLRDASGDANKNSPWTAGLAALATAEDLIKKMKYEEACATLAAAWKPFEQPARGEAVFGDIALALFAATEAAKAVYPEFNAVSPDQVRSALQRAAESDPCQAEALVASAFLASPDPAEAFSPAPLRPSLRARSKLLTKALPSANHFAKPLPWHAPAEFLKAAGNSFVLGDLDFYHLFLDANRPLAGVDRDGQPVHVVMGGGLLTVERDAAGARRLAVYDFDSTAGRWIRMTPRILRVQPADYKTSTWRIDEDQLNADLRQIMADAIAERETLIKRKLLVSAEGLQGAIRVKADMRKIFAYLQEPPKKATPLTFDNVFTAVINGYNNYALIHPDEANKAAGAQQQVQRLSEEWTKFKASVEALRVAIGDIKNGGAVEPEKAATALADFLTAIGAASFDARDLAEPAAAEDGDADATKGKPGGKPAKKNTLDAAAPIQLTGQELRAKMSRQKEQYDLLALFKLMTSVHRKVIDAAATPPPAQQLGPDAPPPSPEERARAAARQRVTAALERYDRAVDPEAADYSLTLDQLFEAQAAARELESALRALGPDSDQTRFLGRFAETIEAVARPVAYEADMQRYCTKANRAQTWQVGRAIWRTYDFPANTSPQTVADMIEHCQRVAFAATDLDAVMKEAVDNLPTADASIPLRSGCTTPSRNRLVHNRNGKLSLQFIGSLTDPCMALLLDIDPAEDAAPACLAAGEGSPLWIEIDGRRLQATVVADKKTAPQLVIDFAGPQGRVPIGAKAGRAAAARFMTDSRGNRIVRDRAPVTSLVDAHFYAMTSKSGDAVTERSLNYSLQDWLDLDRETVNVFLPNAMRLAPTLPTWQRYRREFMRPAPDTGWMWPAPQAPAANPL